MKYSSKFSLIIIVFLAMTTNGQALTITASGFSATNTAVAFQADFSISGNYLYLTLSNNSPVASDSKDDVLSSFYFDILNENNLRPSLIYTAATGDVYHTLKSISDTHTGNISLLEPSISINGGWAFLNNLNENLKPYLHFGLGTVGNNTGTNTLAPNNFPGNIVRGINYSIYHGEVTTQSLDDLDMVRNSATFTFSGIAGFDENDILRSVFFGLGTGPDSNLTPVPEPATMLLVGTGLIGLVAARRRKKS